MPTPTPAAPDEPICSHIQRLSGACTTAGNGPDGTWVHYEETYVGGGAGADAGNSADGVGEAGGGQSGSAGCELGTELRCIGYMTQVTLSDIAHFVPTPAVDSMEPNGWMIVGLDTNFFATGGQHVRDGQLLGMPASVRFTPIAWHWNYGDGATRSSGTPGAPWAAQDTREFDPTATSHVYTAPGTYVIRLSVDFAAEYRIAGGPWIGIPGALRVPANDLIATAGDAKTVLVEHDCTANPGGPGC